MMKNFVDTFFLSFPLLGRPSLANLFADDPRTSTSLSSLSLSLSPLVSLQASRRARRSSTAIHSIDWPARRRGNSEKCVFIE